MVLSLTFAAFSKEYTLACSLARLCISFSSGISFKTLNIKILASINVIKKDSEDYVSKVNYNIYR